MTKREIRHEAVLVRRIERLGGKCLKGEVVAGFPDRIVLLPGGRVAFVELKTPNGVVSALQREWMADLKALGFRVGLCHDIKEVDEFVESL